MPSRITKTVDLQETDLVSTGNSRECRPAFRLEGKLCYLQNPFSMMEFSAITWLSYYYLNFVSILNILNNIHLVKGVSGTLQMPQTPLTRSAL